MAVAHALPRYICFAVEATFCVGPDPGDYPSEGTYCYVTNVDTSGLVEQVADNENNVTHPREIHDLIHTLRSGGSLPFGVYLHGKPGTVTAEAAQATTFHIAELARAALGGLRLGWSIGFSGGTASAPTVDADPGFKVGDFIYAYDDDEGLGDFYRILAIVDNEGTITLTLDRDLHFTPAAADVARAVICVYIHGYATTQHDHTNHKTLTILAQGDATGDVWIAHGCKPTMTIEPITAGQPLQASFECAVTTFDACDETTAEDFSAETPVGEQPLVPGRGSSTKFKLADFGSPLVDAVQRGAITVNPGVTYEPVESASGDDGVLGYVDTLAPAMLEVIVPFNKDHNADFRARVHKHALISVCKSGDETEAVGFYFAELEYAAEPPRSDEGSLTGCALSFRAHLNSASAGSLEGDDKEAWRSPLCMLFTA